MKGRAPTGRRLRRVQQLQLDVGDRDHARPRPIAFGLAAVLRNLLPDPSQAHELEALSGPERASLYRMAAVPVHRRIEYEDQVRRLRRRYRRLA